MFLNLLLWAFSMQGCIVSCLQRSVVHAFVGDSITLNCTYNSTGWFREYWYDNKAVKQTETSRDCVNISSSSARRCTLSLTIEKITVRHTPESYYCMVEDVEAYPLKKWEECKTDLRIQGRPSLPVVTPRRQLIAGRESVLTCSTSGFYPSNITVSWLHNGHHMSERGAEKYFSDNEDGTFNATSSITFIPNVTNHKDLIACQVSHASLIQPVMSNLSLLVNYGPRSVSLVFRTACTADARLIAVNSDVIVSTVNSFLELECLVDSYPPAHIDWKRQEPNSSWRKILSKELRWTAIQEANTGVYWCFTSNSYGEANTSITIVVQKPSGFHLVKLLATMTVTLVVVLAALAIYFYITSKRKWKGHPSLAVSLSPEPDESIEEKSKESAEYAAIWRGSSVSQEAADCLSIQEVPYADILISGRGCSTPEQRRIPEILCSDDTQDWTNEELDPAHPHSLQDNTGLHVSQLEVTRKLSTSSEYAVINYSSKPCC
ncbi:uncharacterized protein LOC117397227 [Acipenser ruthenus]|uniref:uncharacterized protein LOC117397227 n=1 Tax=Acipenser ruthenus TaxID=7906 RepID=UPI0027413084|nr:uncharacterized protein LOC117397227 [Acipenser ruthenus]